MILERGWPLIRSASGSHKPSNSSAAAMPPDIHPALLFALLFGEYREARIANEASDKEHHLTPRDALYTHLSSICEHPFKNDHLSSM